MNKISFLILFFIFIKTNIYSQLPLFHYPLNGNANDNAIHKNNGSLFGNWEVTSDRFGNPCGAIYFDGQTSYLEAPHINQFNKIKNKLSVTAWIKLDKKNKINDLSWATILCKGNSSVELRENPHFRFQIMQSKKQSTVSINTEFTEYDLNYQQHQFKENEWMFIAFVYDGKNVKYCINGQSVFEYSYKGKLYKNNAPLHIGLDIPGAKEFFKGVMDDIKIYHVALTNEEINKIYTQIEQINNNNALSMNCPNEIIVNAKDGCKAYINYTTPTLNYSCNQVTLQKISGPSNNSYLSVGTEKVTFKASDSYGNSKLCSFNITVKDTPPPVFEKKSDSLIIIPTNQLNTTLEYNIPKVEDNCKLKNIKKIQGPDIYSTVPEGRYTITYEATDHSNNTSFISWDIVVKSDKINTTLTDSIKIQDSVYIKTDSILTIAIYDNGKEDNDTVSIYFNKDLIVEKEMIKNKRNGVILVHVKPIRNSENLFISKALNIGTVSPNTLKMEIFEGYIKNYNSKEKKLIHSKTLHSMPGKAGSVKLILL